MRVLQQASALSMHYIRTCVLLLLILKMVMALLVPHIALVSSHMCNMCLQSSGTYCVDIVADGLELVNVIARKFVSLENGNYGRNILEFISL